jgi:hypothetical protein
MHDSLWNPTTNKPPVVFNVGDTVIIDFTPWGETYRVEHGHVGTITFVWTTACEVVLDSHQKIVIAKELLRKG